MSIGGPPVILFYLSTPVGIAIGRASIVTFFLGTDSFGTAMIAAQGLITLEILWRTAMFIPIVLIGVSIGARRFLGTLRRNRGRLRDEAVVLNPFCGRGTTNFAARLLVANTVGIDCNEVAVAATSAKPVTVDPKDIVEEAKTILSSADAGDIPTGEFWELAYDPEVLQFLCRLRTALTHDC